MTKWAFASHRPYQLMSAFSFLYLYIDFSMCIYRDIYMMKFIFSSAYLSQVFLYNLYEND